MTSHPRTATIRRAGAPLRTPPAPVVDQAEERPKPAAKRPRKRAPKTKPQPATLEEES